MTEAEAFAEFVENRESFMLLAKARSKGYKIAVTATPHNDDGSESYYEVALDRRVDQIDGTRQWQPLSHGVGVTLSAALRQALESGVKITTPGQVANAHSTNALVTSKDLNYHPVPGLKLIFTMQQAGVAMLTAVMAQGSDSADQWEPEYGVYIMVDGVMVGQSHYCGIQLPGSFLTHHIQMASSLSAGSHVAEVMVSHRQSVPFDLGKVFASPNVPAALTVLW